MAMVGGDCSLAVWGLGQVGAVQGYHGALKLQGGLGSALLESSFCLWDRGYNGAGGDDWLCEVQKQIMRQSRVADKSGFYIACQALVVV